MASLSPLTGLSFASLPMHEGFCCLSHKGVMQYCLCRKSGLRHIAHCSSFWLQVAETPDMYATVVRPYIDSIPASRIQWVYNILEKKVNALSYLHPLVCAHCVPGRVHERCGAKYQGNNLLGRSCIQCGCVK